MAAKDRHVFYILAMILLIAVFLTYSNHFHNSFHFDDSHTIVNNIYIRNIGNIPIFFQSATTFSSLPTNQSYRPVVVSTLALDYWLGKGIDDTFYFHLSTFVLFLLQGVLMFCLYLRIFGISHKHAWNAHAAFFAVAWYLLHPAGAETINYIISRADSLSTLLVIISFVMFIDSQFCRRFYLYLVPFGIGCLAKPIAAMFAPLLLLYVILFEEKLALTELFAKRKFPRTWSALKKSLPAIGLCLLVLFFIKNMEVPTWIPGGTSQYHYIITQPYVVLHYFTTLFFPISLSADTDWRPLHTIMDARFFVGMLFISVLFYAAVATSKREHLRPVSFGICWFFITVIPTSLIPLAEVMNDHRIFFPYVGLVMSVCWTLFLVFMRIKDSFANERVFVRATASVIVIVLAIYAYGTFQRNKVWKTEETLWQDVTVKSPKNGRGLMNYGLALMGRGEYTGAERYFGRALELNPYYVFLHINMGVLKDATGRHSEAEQYFKNAISFGPSYPESYFYYARSLKNRGRTKDAIWNLEKALQLAPACLDARDLLMDIYFEKPDFGKLGQLAAQTLTIVPNDRKSVLYLDLIKQGKSRLDLERQRVIENKSPEGFLNLSLMYYQAGEYERSIEAAQEALKLRPNYDLAYNNICAAYNELEQWDRAIEAGEKAVKINPNSQIARNNLAWAKQQNMLLQKEQK